MAAVRERAQKEAEASLARAKKAATAAATKARAAAQAAEEAALELSAAGGDITAQQDVVKAATAR
jgi:hypothetical protein